MSEQTKLSRITIYPIKSLDGVDVTTSQIVEGGALQHDRAWALFDEDDKRIWAKTSPVLHQLRSSYSDDFSQVTILDQRTNASETFDLSPENPKLESFFCDVLERKVFLKHSIAGHPDEMNIPGPTVTSVGTLNEVASWYAGLTADDIHRRMRANLVLDSTTPFFEDRLIRDLDHVYAFSIGSATLEGVSAVGRCVVPARDPVTGEKRADFQNVFMQQRELTFPRDVQRTGRFDHVFRLTIRTRVPESEFGKSISVGDELVEIGEREL